MTGARKYDAIDKLSADLRRSREQFARLVGLVEAYEKQVEGDPWPFIDLIIARCERAEACINAIAEALDPEPGFMLSDEPAPPLSFSAEVYARNTKAQRVIDDWRNEGEPS